MKRLTLLLFLIVSSAAQSQTQPNPFLKKYAGSYYVLAFGEEQPQPSSEKAIFTADGKWNSTSFPVDDAGVVSKIPVKRSGLWKASEGLIQRLSTAEPKLVEYRFEDGIFMSADTYLQLIFVSDPVYMTKYATAYHLLNEGEDAPGALTATLRLAAAGSCAITQPVMDDNGNVTPTPTKETTTWKAREGKIQINFKEDGVERPAEFTLEEGVFRSKQGTYLKKVPPPPPPNPFLKLYAGTYYMLTDGQVPNKETDIYVFNSNGKVVWTYFTAINPDGTVTKATVNKEGDWSASQGLIHMTFDMGSFDMGSEKLLSDYTLKGGVFRNGNIFLKKKV